MRTNLEEKLASYEKNVPITNDEELLVALDSIIEEQNALPPEEKDTLLIEEAVNAALSLRGEDTDALEAQSRVISRRHLASKKMKRRFMNPRFFIKRNSIAVAIILLIATTCMVSFAAGFDWLSEYIHKMMLDGDSAETVLTATSTEYESIEAMVEELGIRGVLLPYDLPDGMEYTMITSQISYTKPVEGEEPVYSCIFDIRTTGESSYQEIWIETENLGTTAEGETRRIGGREVTYYEDFGRPCAFFTYNGYTYTVSASEYSELKAILTSLK